MTVAVVVMGSAPLRPEVAYHSRVSSALLLRSGSKFVFEHNLRAVEVGPDTPIYIYAPKNVDGCQLLLDELHEATTRHGVRQTFRRSSFDPSSWAHACCWIAGNVVNDADDVTHVLFVPADFLIREIDLVMPEDGFDTVWTINRQPTNGRPSDFTFVEETSQGLVVVQDRLRTRGVDPVHGWKPLSAVMCLSVETIESVRCIHQLPEELTLSELLRASGTRMRVRSLEGLDYGSGSSYYSSFVQGSVPPRAFNSVSFDFVNNLVVKETSTSHEVSTPAERWYTSIPNDCKSWFPQYLGPRTIELVPALPASYVFSVSRPSFEDASFFFNSLFTGLSRLHRSSVASMDDETRQKFLDDFYTTKSFNRIDALTPELMKEVMKSGIGPYQMVSMVCDERQRNFLDSRPTHGDPVFSNVLFSQEGTFKIIDPRGEFGPLRAPFGDPLYDIAKVYQSAVLMYDLVKSGLVHPDPSGAQFRAGEAHYADLKNAFFVELQRFFPQYRIASIHNLARLLLLTAIPLHGDSPDHQLAFIDILRFTEIMP